MIGKQNQPVDDEDNQSRIKLIANKRKSLEERTAQIQAEIKSCFKELTETLQSREKQLLRQAEAIHRQQLSLVETSLDFLPSSIAVLNDKNELEEQIRRFGNIEIHGVNGITVKDVEPYKVADYQDANKDHVSFDKSITCQKMQDHLRLPRCKDFVSDYKTLRISSFSPTFLIENHLRDARNVKNNALLHLNDTVSLSECSPFLIIKRKLGLTHVSLDGLHAFDRAYPRNIRSFEISSDLCELQDLANETTEDDLQEIDKEVTSQDDGEVIIEYPKEREKDHEHPMQVQQWLRQILAETEIEPAIHEIGQFSEISNAKLCNEL
ncbi:uncharacterized protein LOC105184219 [Harpegnathos saltator]|uniref:Uncharacterized protein n=1 Tax=Harpegnathos saltator TaxID=610380 RepID=E2BLM5_HARSA|nr:uncharacterized protein LOC105184219 [Harpegnathos saltator]EFN83359.1 hypothetical protein EAI_02169 [Harpegnathos saltator]